MALTGTLINGLTIVIGTLLGLRLRGIPERVNETVTKTIGLFVVFTGIQMAVSSQETIIMLISLVTGAAIGEIIDLDGFFERVGHWVAKLFKSDTSNFSEGFVNATLIFVIGAMAIVGALDSGLRHNHHVLITKAIIDGFTSVVLSASFGVGVLLSAVPVIIYQGTVALLATQISQVIPKELLDTLVNEISAVGGIAIMAIGVNLLGFTKIRVANLLPGIVICSILVIGKAIIQG